MPSIARRRTPASALVPMTTLTTLTALAAMAAAAFTPATSHAAALYANLGLPGLGIGVAQPLNNSFTLRADFATLGSHKKNANEDGINYQATAKLNRVGLFGDWFFAGGWRLTGGITSNDAKVNLLAQGNGTPITIGNTTFATDSTDRLNIDIKFPRTTPYLGIGYGHQLGEGWGLVFDLGASFGKAKLTETHSGTHFSQASQADIDAELAQLRDGVGKVTFLPQVSLGVALRF